MKLKLGGFGKNRIISKKLFTFSNLSFIEDLLVVELLSSDFIYKII